MINVITKTPAKGRALAGTATASLGSSKTADTSLELSGSVNRLGYYLSGGYLGSDGLVPTTSINSKKLHARLTWDLPEKGQLYAQFNGTTGRHGDLYVPVREYDLRQTNDRRNISAMVGMRYPLTKNLELNVNGYHTFFRTLASYYNISDGAVWSGQPPELPTVTMKDSTTGANALVSWRGYNNLLVAGADFRRIETTGNSVDTATYSPFNRQTDRWGLFLNDTITLGRFSITPGVRLDHPQTTATQFSSSLGGTWQVDDTTLLRAYIGRGYGMQVFTPQYDPNPTKILTAQLGAENSAIPYLWIKGTLFRNMVWGGEAEQMLALGSELELRTKPFYNTSLGGGWTYTETTRTSDGTPVHTDKPTQTLKLTLCYDDTTFRGLLTGRHIFWNGVQEDNGKNALIWDLHLGATLLKRENSSLELFFSGRNLFNGKYYSGDIFPSVGRWFEGGVRVRF